METNTSRRLHYISLWTEQFEQLVSFLEANKYDSVEVYRLKSLLEASNDKQTYL